MSAVWRKSSRSNGAENSDCVEIALDGAAARIRDSKGQADAVVTVPGWASFRATIKSGDTFRR